MSGILYWLSSQLNGSKERASASGEALLAYPGRSNVDSQAPYKYCMAKNHMSEPNEEITFYQRANNKTWTEIPVQSQFDRTLHIAGIAINPFVFQHSSGGWIGSAWRHFWWFSGLQTTLAHQAVYIREATSVRINAINFTWASKLTSNCQDEYCIYGLNFSQEDDEKDVLILEGVWGTKDGWQTRVKEGFQKGDEYNDLQVYCSIPELILTRKRSHCHRVIQILKLTIPNQYNSSSDMI